MISTAEDVVAIAANLTQSAGLGTPRISFWKDPLLKSRAVASESYDAFASHVTHFSS